MRGKKAPDSEHGLRHMTPAGHSVFYDLFPPEKAAEMEMRAQLSIGLEHPLDKSRMTQAEAAKVLGVTQARVSDLKRCKIDRFSMDLLVRLAARAGLKPKLKLAAESHFELRDGKAQTGKDANQDSSVPELCCGCRRRLASCGEGCTPRMLRLRSNRPCELAWTVDVPSRSGAIFWRQLRVVALSIR
jgi:predicted XRE-type DNA-binding protein